jgi:hypothetical protein
MLSMAGARVAAGAALPAFNPGASGDAPVSDRGGALRRKSRFAGVVAGERCAAPLGLAIPVGATRAPGDGDAAGVRSTCEVLALPRGAVATGPAVLAGCAPAAPRTGSTLRAMSLKGGASSPWSG